MAAVNSAAAAAAVMGVPALDPGEMLHRQQPQKESDAPEDAEREGDEGGFSMELPVCVSETQRQQEGENRDAAIEKSAERPEVRRRVDGVVVDGRIGVSIFIASAAGDHVDEQNDQIGDGEQKETKNQVEFADE